jgi:transposase
MKQLLKRSQHCRYYYCCCCCYEKCNEVRNYMVYMWIQEGPQEGHNNKGVRTEFLQQVGILHPYLS